MGKNRIGFKSGTVQFGFGFGLSIFGSLRVGSPQIGFELGWVISSVGHCRSSYSSGFIRFWISLLRVFGSKSVHPISGVSSGIDPDCSVRVLGLGSVLPSLQVRKIIGTKHKYFFAILSFPDKFSCHLSCNAPKFLVTNFDSSVNS